MSLLVSVIISIIRFELLMLEHENNRVTTYLLQWKYYYVASYVKVCSVALSRMSEWPLATTVAKGHISYMQLNQSDLTVEIFCPTWNMSVCIGKFKHIPWVMQKRPLATMVTKGCYDIIMHS